MRRKRKQLLVMMIEVGSFVLFKEKDQRCYHYNYLPADLVNVNVDMQLAQQPDKIEVIHPGLFVSAVLPLLPFTPVAAVSVFGG